ncbi:MAG: ABC transporter permease [Sporolactobacillus sp.]|jgi:oligopeptide transport system permease protein|nr:ABC transporter permease [Sporolactobacillus sp.]
MKAEPIVLRPELFQPEDDPLAYRQSAAESDAAGRQRTLWQVLFANKIAFVGLIALLLVILMAIFGPSMNGYGYDDQQVTRANLPPKVPVLEHIPWFGFDGHDIRGIDQYQRKGVAGYFWFGTDSLGRDLWTRIWMGTRISLFIALMAAAIDIAIGVTYGSISGFFGGRIDRVMQRIIEVLVGIPQLIILIMLILLLKPGITSIIIAMVLSGWVNMARIVRGQLFKLKNEEFVMASRTLGAKNRRIIGKHLLPNTMGSIIITTMFTIPGAIFTEAYLSFIGLGLQPPTASLGTIVNDGYKLLRIYPHAMIVSSVIISVLMISFNILGDWLRDVLDPKTENK